MTIDRDSRCSTAYSAWLLGKYYNFLKYMSISGIDAKTGIASLPPSLLGNQGQMNFPSPWHIKEHKEDVVVFISQQGRGLRGEKREVDKA